MCKLKVMKNNQTNNENRNNQNKQKVRFITICDANRGQRIDNFLLKELKNVPRSYIYKILRKGEVRINKKRAKPVQKLKTNDVVRIPPVFLNETKKPKCLSEKELEIINKSIVYEDDFLIFINKPSGLAVHGGSGLGYGLIEGFRQLRPNMPFVELVHRLDKDTSGIVMLAKNRDVLLEVHQMLKSSKIYKYYQTLVLGHWTEGKITVENRLEKQSGKRQKMKVVEKEGDGKQSKSIFYPEKIYRDYTLLNVNLLTGRMHQIRTQLADKGFPVIGDTKYGDFSANREAKRRLGLKRLFLHSYHLKFKLESTGKLYECKIPLAEDLSLALERIQKQEA